MKILLKNGTLYPMAGEVFSYKGDILVEDGRIAAIGKSIDAPDAQVYDLTGLAVMPGLIDSHCHIGLFGTAMGDRGVDGNENTSASTPHLRAIDSINPMDDEFEHAWKHGVTCVSTGPGSANPICGQFVTMKTAGRMLDGRIMKEPAAMKMAFGENPKCAHNGQYPVTRMGTAAIIREQLQKAIDYGRAIERAEAEGRPAPDKNIQMEALLPVVRGELPVKAHAHRVDDILTALRIAKEFNLDMSIEHCSEGQYICEELKEAHGVIIGPLIGFPHKLEVKNQTPEAGRVFYEAGVPFAIMSDLPGMHVCDIIMSAGMCIREGLPMEEAMRALTITPAKFLKVDDRVGSLEVGKDADIVVFTANPLEYVNANCVMTLIDGNILQDKREV